jgi:hypothetical protein
MAQSALALARSSRVTVNYGIRFSSPVTALRVRIRAKSNSEAA